MTDHKRPTLDELSQKLFGWRINEYARGSEPLQSHALNNCRPTVAALALPEEYAVLVLTSRMDLELKKLIRGALCRHGKDEELLFATMKPLSSFAAKINLAYVSGLITERMCKAVDACRDMRNCYAHADDPDAARNDKRYSKARRRLLELDSEHTQRCVEDLRGVAEQSEGQLPCPDETVALMVNICESLSRAAFTANVHRGSKRLFALPASFGWTDMDIVDELVDADLAERYGASRTQSEADGNAI